MIKITLAAARVNAGLTQREVAKKMHVSLTTVVNWERGKNDIPLLKIKALSELYKMPLENIILPLEKRD